MNKKQIEAELRAIAAVEDAFKELGKEIYGVWNTGGCTTLAANALMGAFHLKITKLKMEVENGKTILHN